MTVPVEPIPLKEHECDGEATVFSFDFRIFNDTELVVEHIAADDTRTTLVITTDYSVTYDYQQVPNPLYGGYITTVATYPDGDTIEISRSIPISQPVDWENGGPLDMEILEASFDRIIMILQDQDVTLAYKANSAAERAEAAAADAAKSATDAENWANYPEDSLIPTYNEYSAYHWAKKAADIVGANGDGLILVSAADQIPGYANSKILVDNTYGLVKTTVDPGVDEKILLANVQATQFQAGASRFGSQAEVDAGALDNVAISPATLKATSQDSARLALMDRTTFQRSSISTEGSTGDSINYYGGVYHIPTIGLLHMGLDVWTQVGSNPGNGALEADEWFYVAVDTSTLSAAVPGTTTIESGNLFYAKWKSGTPANDPVYNTFWNCWLDQWNNRIIHSFLTDGSANIIGHYNGGGGEVCWYAEDLQSIDHQPINLTTWVDYPVYAPPCCKMAYAVCEQNDHDNSRITTRPPDGYLAVEARARLTGSTLIESQDRYLYAAIPSVRDGVAAFKLVEGGPTDELSIRPLGWRYPTGM